MTNIDWSIDRRRWHKSPYVRCTFVCLFVCLSSHSNVFHSYRDVTITGKGLQIFTFAWYLGLFSSEGALACHTYCDTGYPFIMVISEDPRHTPIAKRLAVEVSLEWGLSQMGFEHPTFRYPLRGERSNRLRHKRGC